MNKEKKRAYEISEEFYKEQYPIDEFGDLYKEKAQNEYIPDVEIGDICLLDSIWNGDITNPLSGCDENGITSISYRLSDQDGINYIFKVIKKSSEIENTEIEILDIYII